MANPRLRSLLIRDFRSISGEWTIPLDAGVVLVHGQNGAGKTSLLSALELACTGTISHLDRAGDKTYQRHLHHRGTRSGQVVLQADGLQESGPGSASLSEHGAECSPLFVGRMAETFIERCFLPQATLGRLLEVYAPLDSREADTPLIRFVKELLGLDALDALIDGLYATGHMSRAQKLSTAWQTADERLSDFRSALQTAQRARAVTQNRVAALTAELRKRLQLPTSDGADLLELLLAEVDQMRVSREGRDADSARLREALLRLDAIESTLVQGDLMALDPNEPANEADLHGTEARYQDWQTSRARPAMDWFDSNVARQDVPGDPGPSVLLRHLTSAIEDNIAALAEATRKLGLIDDLSRQTADARSRLSELSNELGEVAGLRSEASGDSTASGLASVLVSILEHIDGQTCPVCDRDFDQGTSLGDHIMAKVDALNADAARFLELETRKAALEGEQRALAQELRELDAHQSQLGDSVAIKAEEVVRSKRPVELRGLVPLAEAGQLLDKELSRARDAQALAARSRSLLDRCVADLDQVADLSGAEPPRGLLPQRVAALRAHAQGNLDEISNEQRSDAETLRLRDELKPAAEQLEREINSVGQAEGDIAVIGRQIDEAKRRKEVASTLRKDAEAVRTATTTRVFDEHLNGSWARIFRSLVPSEPFVPQFKRIPAGSRRVTVEIQTIDRDGLEAATPAAMLSQGNLNTAALSLFMALHFAVPAQLPWLIFDDPVQSMDDLHISNFAAMVKQLTRRNGRQVVIAVHQRELFEYLSLELTPASPGEEQLQIVLDRSYGRSVVKVERFRFSEDNALVPNPAT